MNEMIEQFATGKSLSLSSTLMTELKEFALQGDRKEVLARVREIFISSRAEAGTLSENVRAKALSILESRLDEMSTPQLIRAIDLLSTTNQGDLAALLGVSAAGKGTVVNVNTNNQPQALVNTGSSVSADPVRNTVQDAKDLLEGLSLVANHFRMKALEDKTISVTPIIDTDNEKVT